METAAALTPPAFLKSAPASPQAFRWLEYALQDSRTTMERDRVYFEALKTGAAGPALRFYRWQRPALSYGRTQGLDAAAKEAAVRDGYDVVRRPTGGGKVRHLNDLCFSLFWTRAQKTIPWKVSDSYCAIHRWIQFCLKEQGLVTQLSASPGGVPDQNKSWCFQSPVEHDLLRAGQKIVGGAQWRDGNYALHQGSLQSADGVPLSLFKSSFETFFNVRFE